MTALEHDTAYRVFKDGNEWCAVTPGFVDLQQSPSAFADTPTRALAKLLAPAEPDIRVVCEALGFDPTNHHNAAKCPYCRPAQTPQAADAIDAREQLRADLIAFVKKISRGEARDHHLSSLEDEAANLYFRAAHP